MRFRNAPWSVLAAAAVMAVPFIHMIHWWTGPLDSYTSENRSLFEHAWWWLKEASFGPWRAPLIVVIIPPLLVLVAMVAVPVRATKARRISAIATAAAAWIIVLVAHFKVGEDIVFSWIGMTLPLSIQAAAVTVWAAVWTFTSPGKATETPGQPGQDK